MNTILIAAKARNNVIGKDNSLIWHIPEDLKRFKRLTMGCPMIMGRKTFESLPGLLPGRPHFVVSRSGFADERVQVFKNLESGIKAAKDWAKENNAENVFVIGGAQIYKQAIENGLVDQMELTELHKEYEGDAFFPDFDQTKWTQIQRDDHDGYSFLSLKVA